jgi:uroporphyrinogen decarboxylase
VATIDTEKINGKELLFKALRHEPLPAMPWVPFAGVHAGRLLKYSAIDVLTDADKLLESLLKVNKVYGPDGQPVVFDLQIEAEILGCKLMWSEKTPPAVASFPLETKRELPLIENRPHLPQKNEGRLPLILDVMRRMKNAVGDHTALYGLVTGPLTLASHLRGTEIFMDMMDYPEYVQSLLAYCADVAKTMSAYYIEAGMDVIGVVDPVVSQVSPRHFKLFLSEPFKDIFTFLRSKNVFSSFFVCGDATKNIDAMCQTGPDSISIDENIDMVKAKQITDKYNITIGGNIPLTTTLLLGTQQDNMKFIVDLVEKLDAHNLIISPGCDMPYDVPPENVIGVLQAVKDPAATRHILANYQKHIELVDVQLPDYAHLAKPLVEVFTIDSATCAACGYMTKAAFRAVEQFTGKVDVVEHKITEPENIARVVKMGIKNLPAILINGQLKYSSVIPSMRELTAEIEKSLTH